MAMVYKAFCQFIRPGAVGASGVENTDGKRTFTCRSVRLRAGWGNDGRWGLIVAVPKLELMF